MFERYFTKNLKEDEEVIKIIRPSFSIYILRFIIAFFFLLLPFFLLFLLLQYRLYGLLLFFLLLLLGSFLILRVLFIWGRQAFILTNRRIIDFDQKGLFSKTVSETPYENITDLAYTQKGIGATLFHYGTINIQTSGPQNNIALENVVHPEKLKEEINDLINNEKNNPPR